MEIHFSLNGRDVAVETTPERRVVDLLRQELGLTGTKEGCGSGECGACTVLIDGENRLSCLMVAAQLAGRRVTTIEGLANEKGPHPLQEAFVRSGAVQCGFCSPGMILTASALLAADPHPTREAIRAGLSGNLCRCTGYQKIVDAVAQTTGAPAEAAGPDRGRLAHDVPPEDAHRCPSPPFAGGSGTAAETPGCEPRISESGRVKDGDRSFPLLDGPPETADGAGPAPSGNGPRKGQRDGTRAAPIRLPRNLPEFFSCLAAEPQASVFAGGTDLFVHLRTGGKRPPLLIGLERIAEIQGVREVASGLWIGAGTPHSRLLADPLIRMRLPILARALATLGSPPIRNMGTIGGNLCTASPAGDALPPLFVLDAEVELLSTDGVRRLPITAFIRGPGVTALLPGEILSGIRIPSPPARAHHLFEKVGQRKSLACTIASLAALLTLSPAGTIETIRLAWGSVAPSVWTSGAVEAALRGRPLTPAGLDEAARAVRTGVSPITDGRATADYRRTVAGNLLLRLSRSAA